MDEVSMNWLDEVRISLKRGNQILFAKDFELLEDLQDLIALQERRVVVLWALDFADESACVLQSRYPYDPRPRESVNAARAWAAGEIKMRQAQQRILACHAFAKEIEKKEDIALCHAVGQACSVVHTAKHALGYPMYDLTALVYRYGIDECVSYIDARRQEYIDRLLHWRNHINDYKGSWASFLR